MKESSLKVTYYVNPLILWERKTIEIVKVSMVAKVWRKEGRLNWRNKNMHLGWYNSV